MIFLILGILLIIIALPEKKTSQSFSESGWIKTTDANSYLTEKEKMEKSLEEFLTDVTGVGKIKVLLSMDEEKDSFYGSDKNLKVTGVLIAAEGADNSVIVREIKQAIMALFPVEAHKIKVMKMK